MANRRLILATLSLVFVSGSSSAAIISHDFQSVGDGLLTYDVDNQREWLDMSQTVGMTLGDLHTIIGPAGTWHGFQIATLTDVESLWISAGRDLAHPSSLSSGAAAISLIDLLSA